MRDVQGQGQREAAEPFSRRPMVVALVVLVVVIAGVAASWPWIEARVSGMGTIQIGLLASFVASLFTLVGALPILFIRHISRPVEDAMMGFGAGVMLAAAALELALPALEGAQAQYGPTFFAVLVLAVGVGLGGGFLLLLHHRVPHEHFILGPQSGADPGKVRRVYLFVLAIALHHLPEGLAVGVGFGGDLSDGMTLAVAIGLQNMPEGLVVAIALLSLGYGKATALGVTLLTGLVQPVGGLVGATAITFMTFLLPWGLAFAAGAMLFVVSHEIIPESHRQGHETQATLGVLVGFVAFMAIGHVLS